MEQALINHLERVRGQTIERYTMETIANWVEKHTHINGNNYSFKDHEYQRTILSDPSPEIYVQKCSQIGISEASSRFALALAAINPYYTLIYTLPTDGLAVQFMRSRIDPIIQSSSFLSETVHRTQNNSEIKRFGDSYLYVRGAQSAASAISVPADHLIHDEVDFSSSEVLSMYRSRLTHSSYGRRTLISTPTFPDRGINEHFKESRRHFNFVRCHRCSHYFVPDYFEHVHIPGFTGELRDIDKHLLKGLRWREAELICPNCGKVPSLEIEHREYVCENPMDNYIAAGYQVSPFDAPNVPGFNKPGFNVLSYLINESTNYVKYTDFVNFHLGIPAEDAESTILEEDLRKAIFRGEATNDGSYVFGLDMGMTCYLTIAKILHDGRMVIEKLEAIPAARIVERRKELAQVYWPRMTVVDNLPYTETVLRMQTEDQNMFGAWYEDRRSLEMYRVRDREEEKEKGEQELRQVNINRNKAFDALMLDVRSGYILKRHDENDDVWIEHLTDMKRVKNISKDDEMSYTWKKSSKGDDHYHHSLLYAYIASKMIGVSHHTSIIRSPVRSFRMKTSI